MTKIICCYTALHPRTITALLNYAPAVEFIRVDPNDDYSYARAIQEHWGKDDLVIVEQDIEIHAQVLADFEKCDHDWCLCAYQVREEILDWCIGCVRFSLAAQQKAPFPMQGWRILDVHVSKAMDDAGLLRHVHDLVQHHHDYNGSMIQDAENIFRREDQSDEDFRDQIVALLRTKGWKHPEKLVLIESGAP